MENAGAGTVRQGLRHILGWHALISGHWFQGLLVEQLRRYNLRRSGPAQVVVEDPGPQAARIIRRTAAKAAALGTGAAVASTSAQVWLAGSQGLASIAALPAAGLPILVDLVL